MEEIGRVDIERGILLNRESFKRIRDGFENGEFPKWFLTEVLIKVPVKVLFGFKLVSKQWFSTISDQSFVRSYISRASLYSQPWTFIDKNMHHESFPHSYIAHFVLLDDVYSQVREPSYCVLPFPFTQPSPFAHPSVVDHVLTRYQQMIVDRDNVYRVSGVSNGLVLYYWWSRAEQVYNYHISNPVTGRWISIPPLRSYFESEHCDGGGGCGFLTKIENGVLKSYCLVRLNFLSGEPSHFFDFQVFNSEIGEWKQFNVATELKIIQTLPFKSTTVNGNLHWIFHKQGIIAYVPCQSPERVRIIALPDALIKRRKGCYSVCAESEGKLKFVQVSFPCLAGENAPYIRIWVLNDSGNWCLEHNVGIGAVECNIPLGISRIEPLTFHPFDSDLLYLGYEECLVTYNVKTKNLAVQHECSIREKELPAWRFTLLLVIPPWPISIP